LWRKGDRVLALILVVPTLFGYLIIDVGRFQPSTQFLSFLELQLLVACAVPLVALVRMLARRPWPSLLIPTGAVCLSVLALGRAETSLEAVSVRSTWTPSFATQVPPQNFREVAILIRAAGSLSVFTNMPDPEGLRHYLGSVPVESLPADSLTQTLCNASERFVYVEDGFDARADTSCLMHRHAISIRVPQTDSYLAVWLVGGNL
jgi:hypothetical protein